ncbi:unnamed protein product [Closterium sp. NIES-54]
MRAWIFVGALLITLNFLPSTPFPPLPCPSHQAFRSFYEAVGLGWIINVTNFPPIAVVVDAMYELFAKYRLPLTGHPGIQAAFEERKRTKYGIKGRWWVVAEAAGTQATGATGTLATGATGTRATGVPGSAARRAAGATESRATRATGSRATSATVSRATGAAGFMASTPLQPPPFSQNSLSHPSASIPPLPRLPHTLPPRQRHVQQWEREEERWQLITHTVSESQPLDHWDKRLWTSDTPATPIPSPPLLHAQQGGGGEGRGGRGRRRGQVRRRRDHERRGGGGRRLKLLAHGQLEQLAYGQLEHLD